MLSNSKEEFKSEKRIDLLFSKFAAFYGHIWRSQFKDEAFFKFAKKEWQLALSEFKDNVLTQAILQSKEFHELPPTLPQVIYMCRQIKRRQQLWVKEVHIKAKDEVVLSALAQCKKILL